MIENARDAIYVVTAIVDRGQRRAVRRIMGECGVILTFNVMGKGTAANELLDYLGLGDRKRDLVFGAVCGSRKKEVLEALTSGLKLRKQGNGILFTTPMNSVGGSRTLSILRGDVPAEDVCKGETMRSHKAELIVTITQRGYAQDVVEAARSSGSQGATVVQGRASSTDERRKFFGIMVEPQKDIVLLLVPKDVCANVMRAITKAAGLKTAGKGICFSLPVTDVVGALGIEDAEFID